MEAPANPQSAIRSSQSALGPALRLRPREVGAILDTAVALYRHNFFTYVGIVALMQVPVSLVLTLANIWLLDPATISRQPQAPAFNSSPDALQSYNQAAVAWISDFLSRFLIILGIGVIGAVLINIATGALAWTIAEGYLGRRPTIRAAYQAVRPRLGSLTGAILVLSLSFVIIFLPPLFLWIYISWSFVSQVIVLEGRSMSAALARSWELVRGSWWRVFAVVLLLLLIRLVVGLPVSLVSGVLVLTNLPWAVQNIGTQFSSLLLTLLYVPVQLAAMTLLYFDLRVRQEGFDLQMALDGRAAELGLEPAAISGGWPYRERPSAPVAPAPAPVPARYEEAPAP
ncbi:MAG: hypothetical protein M3Z04_23550 [Chloroflexota bacterium]|nr:hypothetical protein [Chloroflexota bacterium]